MCHVLAKEFQVRKILPVNNQFETGGLKIVKISCKCHTTIYIKNKLKKEGAEAPSPFL